MDQNQGERKPRVVLIPCPFQGHINPMLQLGAALHSKGYSITIVHTQYNSPNPSRHPEFDFQSIQDGLAEDVIDSGNLLEIITGLNIKCKHPFQECLEQIVLRRGQVTCVIYDDLMYFAEAAANNLELPSIILRTINAATFASRLAIMHLVEEGRFPFQDSALGEPVPDLPLLRFKDLPVSKYNAQDKFLKLIAEACHTRTSSAVVWNTIDCLEQPLLAQLQKQCPVPIFPIGPMHKYAPPSSSSSLLKEDTNCISWLNKQPEKSVLYVSFGSVVSIQETEIAEMARGLANSEQKFLWVIRPGSILGSEWIELLPKGFLETVGQRGCIVKWAPQKQVLAHAAVGGFLTHCGWNSTLESIAEGVPMICRPNFGDQLVNARYISHVWGIGLQLESKLDGEEVARAVRRIMVDEKGEEIRVRAKSFKKKIELGMGRGGSSYNALNKLLEFMSF
ncbi:hypothetical protein Tsubulata_002887 [Turnera subulata]|uniref:Glycosyltransferase n=1 Tax=Turnera subulata TaxID=218843 RepID=A0A9Q0JJ92_9ROSI|nr:hypothetical protein Tsubulata_002887 [Turnera subulata]